MSVTLLSLVTAFFYGLDPFFAKKGLAENPYPTVAAIISVSVNVTFFLAVSFITSQFVSIELGILYFLLAGLLAPGMARIFSYKGIEKLGASVSTPLAVSMATLFAFVLAVTFLREKITLPVIVGVGSICLGIMILGGTEGQGNIVNRLMRDRRYLIFPAMAGVLFGASAFLRKIGLNEVRSPILGATVTSATSWILLMLLYGKNINRKELMNLSRKGIIFFLLSGVCTSLAWLFLFYALSLGKVVTVIPIANSYLLLTVSLSYFFLRDLERVDYKIVIAAFSVVIGIALLSMSN